MKKNHFFVCVVDEVCKSFRNIIKHCVSISSPLWLCEWAQQFYKLSLPRANQGARREHISWCKHTFVTFHILGCSKIIGALCTKIQQFGVISGKATIIGSTILPFFVIPKHASQECYYTISDEKHVCHVRHHHQCNTMQCFLSNEVGVDGIKRLALR